MHHPLDQQRLETLLESATQHVNEVNQRAAQASLDIAIEKTKYFEKIALACAGKLPWLCRSLAHTQDGYNRFGCCVLLSLYSYLRWLWPCIGIGSILSICSPAMHRRSLSRHKKCSDVSGTSSRRFHP